MGMEKLAGQGRAKSGGTLKRGMLCQLPNNFLSGWRR